MLKKKKKNHELVQPWIYNYRLKTNTDETSSGAKAHIRKGANNPEFILVQNRNMKL